MAAKIAKRTIAYPRRAAASRHTARVGGGITRSNGKSGFANCAATCCTIAGVPHRHAHQRRRFANGTPAGPSRRYHFDVLGLGDEARRRPNLPSIEEIEAELSRDFAEVDGQDKPEDGAT